jgi:CubicO group peptidase (beta-lactamase class C family)
MRWLFPITLFTFLSCAGQPPARSIDELRSVIQNICQNQHIPGLMVGITTKDSILFSGGFGYADLDVLRKVTGRTRFRLASITKMFVSLGILKLAGEGKLQLTDELKKIAPEIPIRNDWEQTHPVRIINLLEHTAGFDDVQLDRFCSFDRKDYSALELVRLHKISMICRWPPGERFSYSNTGYVILGYLIEKLTGQPYDQYLTANILRPLKMDNSYFSPYGKAPADDVREYAVHGAQIERIRSVSGLIGPAASLWSCSDDMVNFVKLFLNNGQPVLPAALIDTMETPHSTLAVRAGLNSGYALANWAAFFWKKTVWRGHDGYFGACYSVLAYNRQLGAGFVISSNGNQKAQEVAGAIVDYLEAHQPRIRPDTIPLDTRAIVPFLGSYSFESPRFALTAFKDRLLGPVRVYLDHDQLYIKPLLDPRIRLLQIRPFTFAEAGANTPTVVFTKNDDARNVVFIDKSYYEQRTGILLTRSIALVVILVALNAIPMGILSLIGWLTKKQKPGNPNLAIRTLPMFAVLLLLSALMSLWPVQSQGFLAAELTRPTFRSLTIFAGTLVFGVISLLEPLLIIVHLRRSRTRNWSDLYWVLTAFALCYLSVILWQNGWLGLRVWTM